MMTYISEFLAQPIYAQFFIGFVLVFFFFAFIIELKFFCLRLQIKDGVWKIVAQIIFYPFGLLFLLSDAGFNIIYMPLIYFERANKHGEGWLITSRLQWHKQQPGMYWQKKVSLFICSRFVERVDPGHCTTSKWA